MTTEQTPQCRRCNDRKFLRRSPFKQALGPERCPACNKAPKKPKSERAATHIGECGFCEQRFTVNNKTHRLAKHGFKRPGIGYLFGECRCQGWEPVELSPNTIKELERVLLTHLSGITVSLENHETGKVVELYEERRRPGTLRLPANATHEERYEQFVIRPGDPPDRRLPTFESLLATRIAALKIEIKHVQITLGRAQRRLSTWEPTKLTEI